MNAYSRPRTIALPSLSPESVRVWMERTQDLVLLLDHSDCIAGFFQGGAYAADDLYYWIGQNLAAIVSDDSSPKLIPLLANDAASENLEARWRHINLLGLQNQVIPVLARCMSLRGDGFAKAVFCRDLRPLQEITHKFLAMQQEFDNRNRSLRDELQKKDSIRSTTEVPSTHGLLQKIKQTNYVQVIKETVIILERQCLQALLDEAGGNHKHAAQMAGMSLTEWQERLAFFEIR